MSPKKIHAFFLIQRKSITFVTVKFLIKKNMAQSVLDLVDVQFQDVTNHTSVTSTDTIGLVMPFYWGESDKVTVYNRTSFYEMFPESLPIGQTSISTPDLYSGYAQVKAAFAHGAGEVEIYRPSDGWKYQGITIDSTGTVAAKAAAKDNEKFDESKAVSISLKYAGFIPQSLAYGYDNIALAVKFSNSTEYTSGSMITVAVFGKKDDTYSEEPFEIFEGAADPQANIGGESIFLENIINGVSQFIDVRVTNNVTDTVTLNEGYYKSADGKFYSTYNDGTYSDEITGVNDKLYVDLLTNKIYQYKNLTYTETDESVYNGYITIDCDSYNETNIYTTGNTPSFTAAFKSGIDKGYNMFNDYESSICTLLINPFIAKSAVQGDTSFVDEYDTAIKNIAEYRKNCLAIVGYPIDNSTTYDKATILAYFNNHSSKGSKFCIAIQGQEYFSVLGRRFTLNCVGGYAGAMVNIAKEAHLNQIASGYVYGNYGGSLKKSLLSGPVIDLMEEGINSVYTSSRGNLIWGTRTRYGRQSSYFGKINVMRVCSMLLKNIFPIAIETLHTDAASNPITRASLSTMLNSVIDRYITNQDLQPDSYADCSDSINTDYLTKGGTVLNIILMLHFIGLVERVSIKIIATDTSVTAEFV